MLSFETVMDAYLTDIVVELGQVHPFLGEDMVEA